MNDRFSSWSFDLVTRVTLGSQLNQPEQELNDLSTDLMRRIDRANGPNCVLAEAELITMNMEHTLYNY